MSLEPVSLEPVLSKTDEDKITKIFSKLENENDFAHDSKVKASKDLINTDTDRNAWNELKHDAQINLIKQLNGKKEQEQQVMTRPTKIEKARTLSGRRQKFGVERSLNLNGVRPRDRLSLIKNTESRPIGVGTDGFTRTHHELNRIEMENKLLKQQQISPQEAAIPQQQANLKQLKAHQLDDSRRQNHDLRQQSKRFFKNFKQEFYFEPTKYFCIITITIISLFNLF